MAEATRMVMHVNAGAIDRKGGNRVLGFLKKRRQEAAKRQALEIGMRVMDRVNRALEDWRATSLEMRRTMIEDQFLERLAEIEPEGDLSFEKVAEIEALACVKNWAEPDRVQRYVDEFWDRLSQDDIGVLDLLEATTELEGHIGRHLKEVTDLLNANITGMIDEAVRRRREEPEGTASSHIEQMSLLQLMGFLQGGESPTTAQVLIAVSRRLTDIAYFDHGLTPEERDVALGLSDAVAADIEASLQGDVPALTAYREARAVHHDQARHCGYGSLHWLMEDQGIEADLLIEFIARKEHASLLPTYLEMMESEVIADIRSALLDTLARARAEAGEDALHVLHRLIATQDGAMTMLLSGGELRALQDGLQHPEAARQVLDRLGITH